jgi:hypothetical protein
MPGAHDKGFTRMRRGARKDDIDEAQPNLKEDRHEQVPTQDLKEQFPFPGTW